MTKVLLKHLTSSLYLFVLALTAFHKQAAGSPQPIDVWSIESVQINPERYNGATLANGMIGITSAALPFRSGQTLIYGAYEPLYPGGVDCAVRTIDFLTLNFSIDGDRIERFDQTREFRQKLDLKGAALTTSFEYQDKATIHYTVRALRHLPHAALMEVTVIAKTPITIAPTTVLDVSPSFEEREFKVVDWKMQLSKPTFSRPDDDDVIIYGPSQWTLMLSSGFTKRPFGNVTLAAAQAFVFDEAPPVAPAITRSDGALAFSKELAVGESYRFSLVGATVTSAHVLDPSNEAKRLATAAALQGAASLIARHESAWADLWKSRIAIDGDPETQRDVNSALYHLYSSVREGSRYSIPPMGLSRGMSGYCGHIFWDADTWMLPALVALQPKLARTLVDYRVDRLDAAKKNAARNGYRGAHFPWETTVTGDDVTPPRSVDSALEHHVVASVGLGAWNYYRVTQDRDWLRETGWPIIKETADFWASRVTRNGPGRYDILHVVGADEYVKDVNNDAYTNAAAKENLAAAIAAAKLLKVKPDPDWGHVRDNIPILTFPDGVTRQHATYNGEIIKQADVNLLAHPLSEITDPRAIRRDLDYYMSRNDDAKGPSYSKAVFVILRHRLGETQAAYLAFKAMYEPNLRPPFRTIAESAEHTNPYMVTGAASVLHALIYGFAGLEITDRGLVQRPTQLPFAWKSLTLIGIGPQGRTYAVKGRSH